jgi:hypothetical protein
MVTQRAYDLKRKPQTRFGFAIDFAPSDPAVHSANVFDSSDVGCELASNNRDQLLDDRFWEGGGVELPYSLRTQGGNHLRYAFTGIDLAILQYIRERRFKDLLEYRQRKEELFVIQSGNFQGQFSLDEYGTLRGWMNEIPPADVVFDLTSKQMVPRHR